MNMKTVKELVQKGNNVTFTKYFKGNLWYVTDCGFNFCVPVNDAGDAEFLANDSAMIMMRYIRKHIAYLESASNDVEF